MGGDPEHLDHLDRLLTTYPNCYLDTSATKWVVRELSPKRDEARAFFLKWSRRLLFGTDLVARKTEGLEHYASRYWVHRFFYEQPGQILSPIPDSDAPEQVCIRGLDLPAAVLERIYYKNSEKFFRIKV
jgi:predicted TIM-barrel fold metal-dependent hydrolase